MFELTPGIIGRPALSFFDPFRELDNMERRFFSRQRPTFRTDIKDAGDSYVLEAELPGFKKEDISAQIKNGYLTIKAERSSDADNDNEGYIRRERSHASYSRSFSLDGIDAEKISAEYKDGILSLTLPKEQVVIDEGKTLQIN